MPTVNEALADATEITADSSVDYVIDKDLRTVAIPTRGVVLGVEGDKDVNTVRMECPRYYKGVDLLSFKCRVLYVNANGESGIYEVSDMADDGGTLSFTWLVSALAVLYRGAVQFEVCWQEGEDSNITRAYHTTIAEAQCLVGLDGDAVSQSDAESILSQLLSAKTAADTAAQDANEAAEAANSAANAANEAAAGVRELTDDEVDEVIAATGGTETDTGQTTGGTSDYNALGNKPSINSVTLQGDKTLTELGASELETSPEDITALLD